MKYASLFFRISSFLTFHVKIIKTTFLCVHFELLLLENKEQENEEMRRKKNPNQKEQQEREQKKIEQDRKERESEG